MSPNHAAAELGAEGVIGVSISSDLAGLSMKGKGGDRAIKDVGAGAMPGGGRLNRGRGGHQSEHKAVI